MCGTYPHPQHIMLANGGGFFHNKGTWGCAARKGILFKLSSLAKGILFANFSQFSLGKGMVFGNLAQRKVKLR